MENGIKDNTGGGKDDKIYDLFKTPAKQSIPNKKRTPKCKIEDGETEKKKTEYSVSVENIKQILAQKVEQSLQPNKS